MDITLGQIFLLLLGAAGFWTFLGKLFDAWLDRRKRKREKGDKDTSQEKSIAKLNTTADEHTKQLSVLQKGVMLLLYDRFEHLATIAVDKGEITVKQKEVIHALYDAYHLNGGNGWATELKGMVDELPVRK